MAISTSMAVSFKTELMQANHCFNATVTPTGTTASGSTSVTSVSSLSGVAIGMSITGTGVPANSTVVAMPTTSQITLSAAATASNAGTTLTIAGDAYLMALIKSPPGRSYGATTTNYTDLTAATSDEVSGTGYTPTGTALGNVTPANDAASVAWTTFSPNPSWASATFSTAGCMIYNSSTRGAGVGGRAVSVHDFGGPQSVSAGTLTILIPSATSSQALLRLS